MRHDAAATFYSGSECGQPRNRPEEQTMQVTEQGQIQGRGGGGGGGGGGLRGLKPPPPFPMRNTHFASFNLSMQRHHCMNLTSLNMKRGRYRKCQASKNLAGANAGTKI